jgi:hypothetical protein
VVDHGELELSIATSDATTYAVSPPLLYPRSKT